VNGDSKRTNDGGSSLIGSLGCLGCDFCPALAALVLPVPYTSSIQLSSSLSKLGTRQAGVLGHLSLSMCLCTLLNYLVKIGPEKDFAIDRKR
jgi:hypothetical protein